MENYKQHITADKREIEDFLNWQMESLNKKIKLKVMTIDIFCDIKDLEDKLIEFINTIWKQS